MPGMKKSLPVAGLAVLALTACGSTASPSAGSSPSGTPTARETYESAGYSPRFVVTYDGGVQVVDAQKGKVLGDFQRPGYLRLGPGGDGRHVLVTDGDHFRVLDTGAWSRQHGDHYHAYETTPFLTDMTFDGSKPGHAVEHDGRMALFYDGEGRISTYDPEGMGVAKPKTTDLTLPAAHHGVALTRADGSIVHTLGDEEGRRTVAISKDGKVIAKNDQCPDVHGEAVAGKAIVLGCKDGAIVVEGTTLTKIASPGPFGAIATQAGSQDSPVTLGDLKTDAAAYAAHKRERSTKISLVNSQTRKIQVVQLPAAYTFRSLGRAANGDGLVMCADGKLRRIDVKTGKILKEIKVTAAFTEPEDWQQPRPSLAVEGDNAYVTEPATKKVHVVDLASNAVTSHIQLTQVPDEIIAVKG